MQQQDFMEAHVTEKKVLTVDLARIWIKPKEEFKFQPGQYCTIELGGIARPYSIASGPTEGVIELFLELVPDTMRKPTSLTPKLFHLQKGHKVHLKKTAKGKFLLDESVETQVFVSTVTEVAPFISMLRAYKNGFYSFKMKHPFYVFQGASYHDEFGYLEELKEMEKMGLIVYVPTVSRPQEEHNKEWKGQTGRVNLILEDYFKKFDITPKNSLIYLCGHRGMIEYLGNKREKPDKPLGTLTKAGFTTHDEIYF